MKVYLEKVLITLAFQNSSFKTNQRKSEKIFAWFGLFLTSRGLLDSQATFCLNENKNKRRFQEKCVLLH
jgi:hypothetical protein